MNFRPKNAKELHFIGRFMLRTIAKERLGFYEQPDSIQEDYYAKDNLGQAEMVFKWWKEKFPDKPLEVSLPDGDPPPTGYRFQKMADEDYVILVKR